MGEITRLALKKERVAIVRAREQGAAAVPELLLLAAHAESEVREIALYGLDEVGDSVINPVFVAALLDPETMVRGVAMRALQKRPDPVLIPALLDTYVRSREPLVRHNVALMLGRLGPSTFASAALTRQLQSEADPLAQEGLVVALAKLGDESVRRRFIDALQASRGRDRVRFVQHATYLGESWLLPALAPWLDDLGPVLRVGVDGLPGPEYLRACDAAVNLVVAISGHRFSFPVGDRINYRPTDLAEVRRLLDAISR